MGHFILRFVCNSLVRKILVYHPKSGNFGNWYQWQYKFFSVKAYKKGEGSLPVNVRRSKTSLVKVARLDFFGLIPPKFEH